MSLINCRHNCYQYAIENFNPNAAADIWRLIPQGLPYDLVDDRNDNSFLGGLGLPIDFVNGVTNIQCFNALQTDVQSIPTFGNRLLQQIITTQQVQIRQLFTQYNYAF